MKPSSRKNDTTTHPVSAAKDAWTPLLAALATTTTLWSLNTVVVGGQWQAPSLAIVLTVLVSGVLTRLVTRRPVVVTTTQLLVGAFTLTAYFASGHAVLGLFPGPDAMTRLQNLWGQGADAVQHYSSPVPAGPGISLMIATGILAVAVAVDLSAVGLHSPAVAGVPLLATYCVPVAVVPGGLSWPYFILAAAGWLLLLAHDSSSSLLRWGRLLPRWGNEGSGTRTTVLTDTSALSATGRRLGAVAVAVAVVLPAIAPGLPEGLLTRGGRQAGTAPALTVINPILTLRDSLNPRQNVEVLRFRTDQADVAPLRIVTDDDFDGLTWSPGVRHLSRKQRATNGLPAPPGLADGVPTSKYTMTVQVGRSLDQDFLPLPYPTQRVEIDGRWLYDASSLNVIGDGETVRGKSYKARYLAVRPTVNDLRSAGEIPRTITTTYTRLPESLPISVRRTALDLTSTATTEYDKAMALQQWFRQDGKFTYSTDAPPDGGGDAVAAFLTERSGYCIQFASAMAVMSRTLGIPARIAVGFLPGVALGQGWWSVRLSDAHAWPELYFEGVGWVRFEPTPATRTGAAPSWAQPAATTPATGGQSGRSATSGSANAAERAAGTAKTRQLDRVDGTSSSTRSISVAGAGRGTSTPVPWPAVLVGLLAMAAVGFTPAVAWVGRRRRRRLANGRRAQVEAAWADLGEGVRDLGVTWPDGTTPRQAGRVLAGVLDNGPAGDHLTAMSMSTGNRLPTSAHRALREVVHAVEAARYGPDRVHREGVVEDRTATTAIGSGAVGGATDGTALLADNVRAVLDAVARTRSRRERARAIMVPSSGTTRMVRLVRRAGSRLGGLDLRVARRAQTFVPRRRREV